jgi:tetratricopeptide (TPR) repeat protein
MDLNIFKRAFIIIILSVFSAHIFPVTEVTANQDPIEVRQLNKNVVYLYRSKKFKEAIPMAKKAMRLMNQVKKPSPQLIVQTLNNLAELNRRTGDFVTAETLLLRSLKISVHFLGATHSSVPVICNNLALLYEKFGKFSEAEALYQRSLKIRQKKLGADHPKVITLVHKLAALVKKRTQQNM